MNWWLKVREEMEQEVHRVKNREESAEGMTRRRTDRTRQKDEDTHLLKRRH